MYDRKQHFESTSTITDVHISAPRQNVPTHIVRTKSIFQIGNLQNVNSQAANYRANRTYINSNAKRTQARIQHLYSRSISLVQSALSLSLSTRGLHNGCARKG